MGAPNCITEEVSSSLNNYMTTLSLTGHIPYCTVSKLIVNIFIEELLSECCSLITDEDYNSIIAALNCMGGSCILPITNAGNNNANDNPVFYLLYEDDD